MAEDLRVIKTKKIIKETFLEMRESMPLDKIHVRELCKRAMINKSTFYNHYTDIYELSGILEKEAIAAFLEKFPERDLLLTDPETFLRKMPEAFDSNMDLLQPLFKDRMEEAFYELERQLKVLYEYEGMTEEEDIKITYILTGAMHTLPNLRFRKGYDNAVMAETIADMIRKSQ